MQGHPPILIPDPVERTLATLPYGKNELWSSENFHRHLHVLDHQIPVTVRPLLFYFITILNYLCSLE